MCPASSGSWFYVFGSATLLCFILQIITGTLLALVYVPSTNEAWNSLQYLNHVQYLGWYLRALHNWGSNFMVALMTIHMVQVFLFGAYKYPRELTWVSGVFLLVATLAMAFTGQVMRFDEDAYWGLGIGASITGRVPLIGDRLVHLLLGGPIIAGETLSRFFALHVFVIPAMIIGIVAMHLRLVLTKGINEYPVPGKPVRRDTYDGEYEKVIEKQGVPFVPDAIGKDLIFAALVLVLILACSAIFGPAGPSGPPGPHARRYRSPPRFLFPVRLRRAGPVAGLDGNRCLVRGACNDGRTPVYTAVHFGNGRKECAQAAGCGAQCDHHFSRSRHADLHGRYVPMVAQNECVE